MTEEVVHVSRAKFSIRLISDYTLFIWWIIRFIQISTQPRGKEPSFEWLLSFQVIRRQKKHDKNGILKNRKNDCWKRCMCNRVIWYRSNFQFSSFRACFNLQLNHSIYLSVSLSRHYFCFSILLFIAKSLAGTMQKKKRNHAEHATHR